MAYKHMIEVEERATSLPSPLSTKYAVQVIFGTAPVNLAADPKAAANSPVLVSSFEEAEKMLGYSDDWERYTLCQSMDASFRIFQVNPVVFINVLDPEKHVKDMADTVCPVKNHQAVAETEGILKASVKVRQQGEEADGASEEKELSEGVDFILDFNEYGYLVITLLSAGAAYGAESLSVSGKVIDPSMVTEEDMIGSYDVETGIESGMEVLRQVYPKLGMVPGILLAPGWTENPNIGAALQGKCEGICGVFRCMCLLDLDAAKVRRYTDCEKAKDDMGYDEKHSIVLWPRVTADGRMYRYSAVYGAMMSYYTATNEDIPYLYPSNKGLNVDGVVLADKTEVYLDQVQAGIVNGAGVVTAVCDSEWKSYGNNTGCYPANTDPKDRWIGCRRMFDYVSNYFATEYRRRLDENMNRRLIDDIVNSFNIWGNSLKSSGMCAGLYAEYRAEENTIDDALSGHLNLRIYLAPYTPAEYIHAVTEFDVSALEADLSEEG